MPTPAKYDVATVEALILELAAKPHPRPVTADELAREVICDPNDEREKATFEQAIRRLREVGLFDDRDDKVVEPTPAGLRAVAVLNPPATTPTYPQN
ncbi:MAG TPA: helix-turn-helix domain-containing protein [Solirubrobacterales bacterium]|nr:helix-turn-helix domain-containing protein [Solirubrobacterales bacterium]